MKLFPLPGPVFAPEDGAGAAAATLTDPGAAAVPPASTPGTTPAAAPPPGTEPAWHESTAYDAETQAWLKAKGFAEADPVIALAKMTKSARAAEKLVGKGPEAVLDRPAKDQPLAAWRKANAEALGLPKDAEGYAVTPPEDWPKDMPWDAALEAEARKLAFEAGIDPDTHKGYVGLFAKQMARIAGDGQAALAKANETMMAELSREHGAALPEVLTQARQAAQHFGALAGLDATGLAHVAKVMADGVGDAATIKFMAAIGKAIGEDSILGAGKGDPAFGMTPAQAKLELDRFQSPEGEYGKAMATGDTRTLKALEAKRMALGRLAALAG